VFYQTFYLSSPRLAALFQNVGLESRGVDGRALHCAGTVFAVPAAALDSNQFGPNLYCGWASPLHRRFFNVIGALYFAALHAAGRTDITAKIHMAELPLYLVLLFSLIDVFGILGAARAWVARIILDTALLVAVSVRR